MSTGDRKVPFPADTQPLFSPEERAALRRDLGPSGARRARVREALLSSVALGTLTPPAQRVDALMHGHAAGAAGVKASAATALHALSTKIIVAGLVVASGATAVVMYGAPERGSDARASHSGKSTPAPVPQVHEGAAPERTNTQEVPAQGPATHTEAAAERTNTSDAQSPAAASLERTSAPDARAPAAASPARAGTPAGRAPGPVRLGARALAAPRSRSATHAQSAHAPRLARHEPPTDLEPPAATAPTAQPTAAAGSTDVQVEKAAAAPEAPSPAVRSAEPRPAKGVEAQAPQATQLQLSGELLLVKSASDALQRRDPESALRALQSHKAQFPAGALQLEAEALRAIALCQARAPDSAVVSARFIRAHAHSALAERVQHACSAPRQDADNATP